jgi:hypothetical protein
MWLMTQYNMLIAEVFSANNASVMRVPALTAKLRKRHFSRMVEVSSDQQRKEIHELIISLNS